MGCCSVTQRHTGVDEVGPDEIELLELSGDNLGVWSLGETRLQLSVRNSRDEQLPPPPPPPPRKPSIRHLEQEVVLWGRSRDELHHRIYSQQPIRGWEGQPAHMYGEIIHSSLVSLFNSYTQETSEHFLVLFSFHLLILSLDHSRQDFLYEMTTFQTCWWAFGEKPRQKQAQGRRPSASTGWVGSGDEGGGDSRSGWNGDGTGTSSTTGKKQRISKPYSRPPGRA